jgi:hypothetical protein
LKPELGRRAAERDPFDKKGRDIPRRFGGFSDRSFATLNVRWIRPKSADASTKTIRLMA